MVEPSLLAFLPTRMVVQGIVFSPLFSFFYIIAHCKKENQLFYSILDK